MSDNSIVANGERVLTDLNALRAIGTYKTGVHKPTLSEPHLQSLGWLTERFPEAGLTGTIDGIGNVIGTSTRPGPKLLAGSHLESQNHAGWLDGPLGVVYALEAARVINSDPSAQGAVEVAAWCDEEGHFGHFLGSRSYAGLVSEADIDAAQDRTSGRPMREALRDAGLALARFCVAIDQRFPAVSGPRTVWTTGRITLDPGAPSIIPGRAEMLFQIRDDDAAVIDRLEMLLRTMAEEATAGGPCRVTVERIRTGSPAKMDPAFQDAIEAASAAFAERKSVRMPSGAGHDAQILATIMPAGMLFVPSIGGVSHHWTENTDDADIVRGAQVFVDACRRLLAR